MNLKSAIKYATIASIFWMFYLIISINQYSKKQSTKISDVAIILGAGSHNGIISPVFRERLNHAIKLYNTEIVENIIITGGFGSEETISDSQAGKNYVLSKGVPIENIYIEEKSLITQTNLINAKIIMNEHYWSSALIVSDPIHMKRAMALSSKFRINGEASPTQTSMYKSWQAKFEFLFYESFYYSVEFVMGHI
jgi:uncharacterized SAM-binding protein YcdF (DUF218 family)